MRISGALFLATLFCVTWEKVQWNVAGAVGIGAQRPIDKLGQPVEEHRLDADVVVEVLEVAKPVDAAQGVGRELRGAVAREVKVMGGAEAVHTEQAGDAPAAGDVGLEAVDAADQVTKVGEDVAVLPGRDVDVALLAYLAETVAVVG